MKIKVQKNPHSSHFLIEIPSSLNVNQIGLGEKFTVFIINDSQERNPIEACFIADKRSMLIQDEIIRIDKSIYIQKNEIFSTNLKLNGLKTFNHFSAHIVKPVEPKKNLTNKNFGELKSPMTGKVISIHVNDDSFVKEGDILLVLEAMKMENRILAEADGIVRNIKIKSGMNVTAGDVLLSLIESTET